MLPYSLRKSASELAILAANVGCIFCDRPGLVQSVLEELEGACGEPLAEVARLQHLQRVHSFSPSSSCTLCLEEGKRRSLPPELISSAMATQCCACPHLSLLVLCM